MIWVAPFICLEMSKYSLNEAQRSIQNLSFLPDFACGNIFDYFPLLFVKHSEGFCQAFRTQYDEAAKSKMVELSPCTYSFQRHSSSMLRLFPPPGIFFNSDQKDIFFCPQQLFTYICE